MNIENLLYIEDINKKKLFYRFTPAAIASQFVPLIIILDDEATHFEYKMWHVLSPIHDKKYLLNTDLLQELIRQVIEDNECEDHIYLYGSGRGAYEAILQGIACKANAVYIQDLSLRLEGISSKKNNLSSLFNPTDSFPIFFLCKKEDSIKNNVEDQIEYFVDICKKHGIKHHIDRCIHAGDDEGKTIKEVLNMLERMTSQN
ncbi:MAG TPA: hypothetical protein EYO73_00325 [Sulfurimonas sp.]|nr:hypothetical protein [Sulfurimonas sp.]